MRCSFISDLHLDSTVSERIDAFHRFVLSESLWCDELYVLGDLTEVWIGDDDDSPFANRIRMELLSVSTNCRIFLMHGNRDFLVGPEFANACGANLIDDPTVVERNGKRLLLCHGDAFCSDDVAYQATRAVLRSHAWQDDVLSRSLHDRRELAASMRDQSRAANANKPTNIMDATERAVADAQLRHHADVVIHGHTHRPGIHQILPSRSGNRYVLGDWYRCGWVLRFEEDFTLVRFPLGVRCET